MKRREFITLLGGAAAAWPLAARAQQGERMRRIGVLMHMAADDPDGQARIAAFLQGLQQLGWTSRPQRADRHSLGCGRCRAHSQVRGGIGGARAGRHPGHWQRRVRRCCKQATRTVPIVFAMFPIRSAPASSTALARPGGNVTGFLSLRIRHQREMAGAAQADRAGRDAGGGPSRSRHYRRDRPVRRHPVRGAVARRGACVPVNVRDAGEIERAVAAFARSANGGLIVTASASAIDSSRPDHRARGPAPIARGLSRTRLRRRRRPDLLRA